MVNVCLYIHHTNHPPLCCLLFSIQIIGGGSFLLGTHLKPPASSYTIIDTLYRQIMSTELYELYNGIVHTPNYLETGSTEKWFIQCELITNQLDAPALASILNIEQTFSSFTGCQHCRNMPGDNTHFDIINKCSYIGHRQFLPINNRLRYLGQSRKCCTAPQEIIVQDHDTDDGIEEIVYSVEEKKKNRKKKKLDEKYGLERKSNITQLDLIKFEPKTLKIHENLQICHTPYVETIIRKEPGFNTQWFNEDLFSYEKLFINKKIYFKDCDLRQELETNIIDISFINRDAIEAAITGEPVGGVKGLSALINVPNFNMKCVMYDPFHTIANIAKQEINLLKGMVKFIII